MTDLRQSTAETIVLGVFVDDTDGKTAETALTISQADIRLSKNGGAFAQTNNAAGATHMEFGNYSIPLNSTDTNTLGRLRVSVSESGALPVWRDFMVMPANAWDALYGADKLQVHVDEMTAGIITAAVIATDAIDADAIADGAITAGVFANDAITAAKIADGAIDAATFAANAITDAAVASDVTIASVTGAVGSVAGAVGSVTGNVGGNVVGSVASVSAGVTVTTNNDKTGYGLSAAAVQAIWDALTSVLTAVGSIGKLLVDNINATIGSRATPAQVNTEVDTALADYDPPTRAELTSDIASLATFIDTEVAAILVDTGTDIPATLATIAAFLDTEIAAILAKTDLIPAAPAATGDVPTAIAIADALLGRSVASVEGTAGVYTLAALVLAAFESAVSGTVWTIKRTDGTTTFATRTVATDAAADPIVSVT